MCKAVSSLCEVILTERDVGRSLTADGRVVRKMCVLCLNIVFLKAPEDIVELAAT